MVKVSGCLAIAAAASIVTLHVSNADAACSDISDASLDIIADGLVISSGAPFATQSIMDAFPYTSADIRAMWGTGSPTSATYYAKIVAGSYFTQITTVASVQAGDLFVVNATTSPAYSGHTVVVTGAPIPITALNPIYAGTSQWALPIADSTTSTHGCNATWPDSRFSGTCASPLFTPGPGTAYMRVYSDTAGTLIGHTWSVTSGGTYYGQSSRPITFGRLNPCPA